MTLKEAIEKAGPGGAVERGLGATQKEMFDVDYVLNARNNFNFSYNHITATDWEVVEPERIEVGDTATRAGKSSCSSFTCEVISAIDPYVLKGEMRGDCDTFCHCMKHPSELTLIRKGPRKHVLKGKRIKRIRVDKIPRHEVDLFVLKDRDEGHDELTKMYIGNPELFGSLIDMELTPEGAE
jgi:hypothetical protein